MEEKETEQMREYLRIKKLEEEDKSDELIEEVYNKAQRKNLIMKLMKGKWNKYDKRRENCNTEAANDRVYELFWK